MIIVSQDKTRIINFDNVNMIQARNTGRIVSFDNTYVNNFDDCADFLGKYDTEERAKEVLQEIWKFYEISKRYECSSNNGITIFLEPKFAYQMPEK